MFLIDLNNCYFKVVNGGRVWTHDLDELQWLIPDNEPVHVRKGKEVAQMPLGAVYQWLFAFGPNVANYPEQYIDQVLKRLVDVNDWEEFEDGTDQECFSYHCDGTCETCSAAYMELLSASKWETNFSADEIPF